MLLWLAAKVLIGRRRYRAVEEGDTFDVPASSCTVATTGELKSVGPVDAVILCVKTFQVASSIEGLGPLVGEKTVIITTQNGVEAHDTIAAVYGQERTLCGVVRVLSYIEKADTAAVQCTPECAALLQNRLRAGELPGEKRNVDGRSSLRFPGTRRAAQDDFLYKEYKEPDSAPKLERLAGGCGG